MGNIRTTSNAERRDASPVECRGTSVPGCTIVGAGLAGSEAAWQVASRGVRVVLHEMRPEKPTAVHKTAGCAELVCSNSFRGDKLDNAVGLLKEEMRRLGSLIMQAAETARVPAGAALAVDRERFSRGITDAVASHPLISVTRDEKASRSTASAAPAGTRASSAHRMISEPSRRISSLRRPTALSSLSPRNEFEHTSSAS